MLQSQMRNYIQILSFVQVAYKILEIGPVNPILQHNVNSSWHALLKRHAIMFVEIGIHWTYTLPQFLDTFWRCCKFVQVPFEKCPQVFNGIQIQRLCVPLKGLKWLSCQPFSRNLAHVLGIIILLKRPTYLDPYCNFV